MLTDPENLVQQRPPMAAARARGVVIGTAVTLACVAAAHVWFSPKRSAAAPQSAASSPCSSSSESDQSVAAVSLKAVEGGDATKPKVAVAVVARPLVLQVVHACDAMGPPVLSGRLVYPTAAVAHFAAAAAAAAANTIRSWWMR